MMKPLLLLGGLICEPMYGYNWVMTLAQLELIGNDKPLTFLKKDSTKKKGKNEFSKPNASKIEEAANRWKAKYSNGENNINLGKFINAK